MVPKSSGGWRLVIDHSTLNEFLEVPKLSMDTAESIRLALPLKSWVVSMDLKDAYYHIPLRPSVRRYLRFSYHGHVWQFKALPFGLSLTPWIFIMVVREVQVMAHKKGIFLHQLKHQSPAQLALDLKWILDICWY